MDDNVANPVSIASHSTSGPSHFIGIGASAGGLKALQDMLKNLPDDTGACFIIVQHLSPDFKSMMLELLSKYTSMTIKNVQNEMRVEPNIIYLIPPGKNMMIAQGELLLSDKMPDTGLNLPIDIFFRSLAEDQQHKAIGIVLSGTGSDGSRGLKALKEVGALVIAQEPKSAKFDGMPISAINTGIIDLILKPEQIGDALLSYIQHPLVAGKYTLFSNAENEADDTMTEIFKVLKIKSEIDFAKYKPSTVARRIERRMTIKQINSLKDYLTLLFKEPSEVQILSKELLIGVTRFFRDDDVFIHIRDKVIPEIISQSKDDEPIRIWSAGCSTGEEAYSLAILFTEELSKKRLRRMVKVFATDVNTDAIADASNGEYSEDIQHDIPPHLLTTYFTKKNSGVFQVHKDIRQMVIFATHNVIIDPPFSNMNMTICRNVLIYFDHSVQKRVLASFHFSIKKGGYLILGSSENLQDLSSHFETVNERARIFRKSSSMRIPLGSALPNNTPLTKKTVIPSVSKLMRGYRGLNPANSSMGFASEVLISHYAPPCILLNENQEAMHVYGDVSEYVRKLPPGRISVDIKDLVNEDISIAVTSALTRARESKTDVSYSDVVTQNGENKIALNLKVKFLKEHEMESSPFYFWLIFERVESNHASESPELISFDEKNQSIQRIEDLELELSRSQEHLQVTVEELETTNEELQSANEELMSANEELQSTNEELQSVNEELYTVNSEYQEKIAEISQANNDLDEVLSSSKIGIIFLDENLLIRRFTETAAKYINLMETDINRPLHHISKNIEYDEMLEDVTLVFKTGKNIEKDIKLADKRVLRITINAYKYSDVSDLNGVAITFSDISRLVYTKEGMSVAFNELKNSINNALDKLDNNHFKKDVSILVLGDDQSALETLNKSLKSITEFSVKIETANSVDKAMKGTSQQAFDVCIVDYFMSSSIAIDFIQKFHHLNNNIPVIVITASPDVSLNAMLLSYGVLDLISKEELSPSKLEKCIRYAVRRRQIDLELDSVLDI